MRHHNERVYKQMRHCIEREKHQTSVPTAAGLIGGPRLGHSACVPQGAGCPYGCSKSKAAPLSAGGTAEVVDFIREVMLTVTKDH